MKAKTNYTKAVWFGLVSVMVIFAVVAATDPSFFGGRLNRLSRPVRPSSPAITLPNRPAIRPGGITITPVPIPTPVTTTTATYSWQQCQSFAYAYQYGAYWARSNTAMAQACEQQHPSAWAYAFATPSQCHILANWMAQGVLSANITANGINPLLPTACAQLYPSWWNNPTNPSEATCRDIARWEDQGVLSANITTIRNGWQVYEECNALYPYLF